jgi:hypothetical protein
MRQSAKTTFIATNGLRAFLPCRTAVVAPDPAQKRDVRALAAGLGVATAIAWRHVNQTMDCWRPGSAGPLPGEPARSKCDEQRGYCQRQHPNPGLLCAVVRNGTQPTPILRYRDPHFSAGVTRRDRRWRQGGHDVPDWHCGNGPGDDGRGRRAKTLQTARRHLSGAPRNRPAPGDDRA